MNNADIAEHFSLLSKLMDINGENSFKSKTYSIAAFHIEKLEYPLKETDRNAIAAIKGLGPSVAAKIIELLDTGSMNALQEIIENTPAGVREMLHIKGLGPKKIHTVWQEMNIQSIGELEYACIENRLTRYKGFGAKTQANVLEAIQFYNQNIGHFLYAQVATIYPTIQNYLNGLFGPDKVAPAGDFRRQMLIIKELEFIIAATPDAIKPKFQTAYPPELLEETETFILYKLTNGLKLRLYFGTDHFYKKQFLYSSGESFINAFMEHFGKDRFNNAVFSGEKDIFEKAGADFVPPCYRETSEAVHQAISKTLPQVLEVSDIKGIIHNHSTWSDGVNTIEELATDLIKNGFEYFVISDHSKTAAYANGLSEEKILQQHQQVDELNKKLAPFKIFKSIESDILNDGNLDYSDEVLASFDLVIASVHSNLYMKEDKGMQRLIKAIENPYTTILGHPTGRLLLSRNGYPINHQKIIDACAANKVAIEINANPHRLDLDWQWISYAMEKGVPLSVNPDAHSIAGLYDIRYGVLAAQKGGLTRDFNLSSFTLPEFEQYLADTRAAKR
ncbi:helix-hairpin-helix domain-containing protein [Niabella yanshanensis]|uniref:Helix-hairpin-helix domain-containing protein n=1 Tax=Niabella yanshanensis TaxID=577386 RepID=A0ABZ0W710_9BACT|nr:DNA polymerase/3'-5' exonuclease PolX [Niabella yanshanensis]WQD38449.1 helix-hairpin-helix domain-containing protein [Niabella yanshanensis]